MTRGAPRNRPGLVWTGAALLLAHFLLVFFAPASSPEIEASSMLERMFPGVSPVWVALRLACLVLGSVLLAAGLVTAGRTPAGAGIARLRNLTEYPAHIRGAAILAAAIALGAGVAGPHLPAAAGFLCLALPFLPALIVSRGSPVVSSTRDRDDRIPAAAWVVTAIWLAWRIPASVGSARSASVVDTWPVFEWLSSVLASGANPLTERTAPGVADGFMFLLGGPLLPSQPTALLASIQVVHCLWIAAAALAIAKLTATWIEEDAGPVAATTFLFSPMVLFMPYSPSPFGIFVALGAFAAIALSSFVRTGSPASGLAFAAVAGTATMSAHLWLPIAAMSVAGLWFVWKQREQVRIVDSALAAACLIAAALPHLPDPSAVTDMFGEYVKARGRWGLLEQTVFGQRSPFGGTGLDGLWTSASPQAFDIAAAGLLAPWAVARTPLRLWGDVLFDPLSIALAAVALALCIRGRTRPARLGRIATIALLATLLPAALTSSYDVPSMTRAILLPLSMAFLAGLGYAALRPHLAAERGWVAPALVVAVIALGGAGLFDGVNRRLLAASSLELAIETFTEPESHSDRDLGDERRRALLLDFQRPEVLPWLHTATVAGALAPSGIRVRGYEGAPVLYAGIDEPVASAYAWSPGLEMHEGISEAFCGLWPDARIYRLVDFAGRSSLLVGIPPGSPAAARMDVARSTPIGCPPDALRAGP